MTDWKEEFRVTEEARASFERAFNESQQKLASANALLERARKRLHLSDPLDRVIEAHLASAQPAAQSEPGPFVFPTANQAWQELEQFFRGGWHDCANKSDEDHERAQAAFRVVADDQRLAARTAAEQRVLDACKTVEHASLEYYVKAFGDETGWGAVSAAELARREGKS